MTSLVFPDLNVWIALTLSAHEHHSVAWDWYQNLRSDQQLVFCRITQVGFLRLVTTESVAKHEKLSQTQAWAAYDLWIDRGGCVYREEPFGIEMEFREFANRSVPAPKEWADSYLAAFAASASLELVTFDRALSSRAKMGRLLGGDLPRRH